MCTNQGSFASAGNQLARVVVRLEVTKPAKGHLARIAKTNGMPQATVTSRVLEWFAVQDDLLQSLILGHYPLEIQGEVAKVILKRLTARAKAATRKRG